MDKTWTDRFLENSLGACPASGEWRLAACKPLQFHGYAPWQEQCYLRLE